MNSQKNDQTKQPGRNISNFISVSVYISFVSKHITRGHQFLLNVLGHQEADFVHHFHHHQVTGLQRQRTVLAQFPCDLRNPGEKECCKLLEIIQPVCNFWHMLSQTLTSRKGIPSPVPLPHKKKVGNSLSVNKTEQICRDILTSTE